MYGMHFQLTIDFGSVGVLSSKSILAVLPNVPKIRVAFRSVDPYGTEGTCPPQYL